jgi:acetylglutamate kinase
VKPISNSDRARALIDALPYIQQFRGKTIVIKYGGNAMINGELKQAVVEDLILISCLGICPVLVHGGGPEIEALLKKLGKESRFVAGLRCTDEETMEAVQMALCGKVNKDITAMLQAAGGRAVGLSGLDGALLKARRTRGPAGEDLGLVGEIEAVERWPLDSVIQSGAIPVISTAAFGLGDDYGRALNVNADIAAAKLAAAIGAEKLILMTDVPGLLRDVRDPDSLITALRLGELEALKAQGVVSRGMIPKLDCCALALSGGVKKAHIIDGRVPHVLLLELFTDEGIGTMIE